MAFLLSDWHCWLSTMPSRDLGQDTFIQPWGTEGTHKQVADKSRHQLGLTKEQTQMEQAVTSVDRTCRAEILITSYFWIYCLFKVTSCQCRSSPSTTTSKGNPNSPFNFDPLGSGLFKSFMYTDIFRWVSSIPVFSQPVVSTFMFCQNKERWHTPCWIPHFRSTSRSLVLPMDVNSRHRGIRGMITFRNGSQHFFEFRTPPVVLLTKGWAQNCPPSFITLNDVFKMRYSGKESQALLLRFSFLCLETRN